MTSRSRTGPAAATINLEFAVGIDYGAQSLAAGREPPGPGLPAIPMRRSEPTLDHLRLGRQPHRLDDASDSGPGVEKPMQEFGDFANDVVKERLERVEGVALVNVYGGVARELQVLVDPERLAAYRITIPEVVNTLRA